MMLASLILGSALSTAAVAVDPGPREEAGLRDPFDAAVPRATARARPVQSAPPPVVHGLSAVQDPFVGRSDRAPSPRSGAAVSELRDPFATVRVLAPEQAGAPAPEPTRLRSPPLRDPFAGHAS